MITKEQQIAILRVYLRDTSEAESFLQFRRRVMCPTNKGTWISALESYAQFRDRITRGHNCLMLQWKGMWLGIEPDGYTHS